MLEEQAQGPATAGPGCIERRVRRSRPCSGFVPSRPSIGQGFGGVEQQAEGNARWRPLCGEPSLFAMK